MRLPDGGKTHHGTFGWRAALASAEGDHAVSMRSRAGAVACRTPPDCACCAERVEGHPGQMLASRPCFPAANAERSCGQFTLNRTVSCTGGRTPSRNTAVGRSNETSSTEAHPMDVA
jgi:hypothetical protein